MSAFDGLHFPDLCKKNSMRTSAAVCFAVLLSILTSGWPRQDGWW